MANPTPETNVAEAINRVLEAEHEAAAAIAAAEDEAEATLSAAREARRRQLETARERASRVHVRAQSRLAAAISRLDADAGVAGADRGALESLAQQAIDNLARRLTCDDHDAD